MLQFPYQDESLVGATPPPVESKQCAAHAAPGAVGGSSLP